MILCQVGAAEQAQAAGLYNLCVGLLPGQYRRIFPLVFHRDGSDVVLCPITTSIISLPVQLEEPGGVE